MTEKIEDGGAAFSRPMCATVPGEGLNIPDYGDQGMSVRDYFAAHCPITFTEYMRGEPLKSNDLSTDDFFERFCNLRMRYADAMLKARKP